MNDNSWTLTARWVFPIDGPPLAHGIVTIANDRISAVQPAGRCGADVDLGNVAIVPGLVNAHTHLDLTGLRGQCPPTPDFTQWLRGVIAHRRRQTPEQVVADISTGLAESMRCGTTLLGDIAAQGMSWSVLMTATMRSVVFFEMLGLTAERVNDAIEAARFWMQSHTANPHCRAALSPHAPYSTHKKLYDAAADLLTEKSKVRLATHLAETTAELELLADRTGSFVEFLTELGIWNPEGLAWRPEQYIEISRQATAYLLLIHCNYLPAQAAIPPEATIVYCPRTHAAFGHAPHPFRTFLKRRVRVALGTDSLASNPDLDVLAEARFLYRQYPDCGGDAVLHMATLSGAEALGWADETGSLTPGKSADLAVVPLPDEGGEPHHLLLSSTHRVRSVLFRGQWTVLDDKVTADDKVKR